MTDRWQKKVFLADEAETIQLAQALAKACDGSEAYKNGLVVYLQGDLGAGKSFLSRAFIQSFLPGQKVKSPTYTIVESYNCYKFDAHHLDLYRLCDPEELEYLAIRDLFSGAFVALVEWPQKGQGVLPAADVQIAFTHLESGREVELQGLTQTGKLALENLVV